MGSEAGGRPLRELMSSRASMVWRGRRTGRHVGRGRADRDRPVIEYVGRGRSMLTWRWLRDAKLVDRPASSTLQRVPAFQAVAACSAGVSWAGGRTGVVWASASSCV